MKQSFRSIVTTCTALATGVATALLTLQPAFAQDRLSEVTALWLSGDDAQALPQLAELARTGNLDARLLLARIETQDLGPSPYRVAMDPDAAKALFRDATAPTLWPQTWLSVEAAKGAPRAVALQKASQPEPDLPLISQLHALGEAQASDHPTRILALRGSDAEKTALKAHPALLPELAPYLAYLSDPPEPRGDGLAALRHITGDETIDATERDAMGMAGILALGFHYGDHDAGNPWRPIVEHWLLSNPASRPVAALCETRCPQQAGACSFAMMALNGGYFELIRIDSPLETVIPQERFLHSPRAAQMVLRRATLARAETNLKWLGDAGEIAEISQCAADLVTAERAKY